MYDCLDFLIIPNWQYSVATALFKGGLDFFSLLQAFLNLYFDQVFVSNISLLLKCDYTV